MVAVLMTKRVLASLAVTVVLLAGPALGRTGEDKFYQAYYLEHAKGDAAGAAKLYAEVADARDVDAAVKAQAERNLVACQEELACSDFARLMPPETLAYFELNRPGEQLERLVGMLGLLGGPEGLAAKAEAGRFAVSPVLLRELFGLRGAAVAITGFDPMKQQPAGVAVFHPGDLDVIRGLIETALPVAAEPGKPIEGYPTYSIEADDVGEIVVCLTSKLVVISPHRQLVVGVVKRLKGETKDSLATSEAMADVFAQRGDAVLFFCVNAKPLIPIINGVAGFNPDLMKAQALLDLNSLRWVAARGGVGEHGLFLDLAVSLEKGHHNLAYNLLRTPPITPETLKCVPKGVAGFVAGALGEPGLMRPTPEGQQPTVTGLDIFREIFANVVDFAVCVLPPTEGAIASPIPDVAAIIRVNDPTKSEALWGQILGIASMAAGAPTMDGTQDKVAGGYVRTYTFPEGVTVHFGTSKDKIVVGTTRAAIERAMETVAGGPSVLDDAAFAPSLKRVGPHSSKAVFLHPGRCLQVARPHMDDGDLAEAEPYVGLLTDMVVSVLTDEAEEKFQLSATVTGLPNVSGLVTEAIRKEMEAERASKQLAAAEREGRWDDAAAAVDQILAANPRNADYVARKIDILAGGKGDPAAAMAYARKLLEGSGDDAQTLNNVAWHLLTESEHAEQLTPVAVMLAEKACEQSEYGSCYFLDTLALAKFRAGDVDKAVELGRKALACPGADQEYLNEALAKYLAGKPETALTDGSD